MILDFPDGPEHKDDHLYRRGEGERLETRRQCSRKAGRAHPGPAEEARPCWSSGLWPPEPREGTFLWFELPSLVHQGLE